MTTFDLGPVRALRPEERSDAVAPSYREWFATTWKEATDASNFDAHLKTYSDAFDGIADRVKAATGEALDNPFRSATFGQSAELLTTFSREAIDGSSAYAGWRQRVQELKAKHPDKMDWDSLADEPGKVAFESMKKAREASDTMSERIGMVNPKDIPVLGHVPVVNSIAALGANAVSRPVYTAAQLAASFAAQMTSPADAAVNMISFGVGGAAKSIIKNATLNALSNAAGQALLSGPKQLSYKSAGLPYGLSVWAEEVGAAAGAGFALDAGVRTPGRAAIRRFGGDTPAGTSFSRNTERGSFWLDAPTDATPQVRTPLQIDAETIKKAQSGDIEASKSILEKTGAMEDPATKFAVDHIESVGRLDETALRQLDSMGVARADGMRTLADAMAGRFGDLPEPIQKAAEPLAPERGAPILNRLAEVEDQVARLPQRLQEAVTDGLEAGMPNVVRAVEDALRGPRESLAERIAQLFDARTFAATRLHGGRASVLEMAQHIRQFPDIINDTLPLDAPRIERARAIARLDAGAFEAVAKGDVPSEVAVMVSRYVPQAQQARVIADLQKARPGSLVEAADLMDTFTLPDKKGELAPGARISEPNGPEAKAHTEQLKNEIGQAYDEAMAPIERRNQLEQEIENRKGQIAKLEEDAKARGPSPADHIAALRSEIHNLDMELTKLKGELDPSEGGQQLYRMAMRALARRRADDIRQAVNAALDFGQRITPEGTRIDVVKEIDGGIADAVSNSATGHIQLAINAVDPTAKIGHEAVHTLVTRGLISPDEVKALAKLARDEGTFGNEATYREAYKDRADPERLIEEEAAASYIEARIRGKAKGIENTTIARIQQFIERLKNLLNGYGFQSREDVVQALMRGDMARREARADWGREAVREGKASMAVAAEKGVTLPGGDQIKGVPLFAIKAFHGSPHDFDRFDVSKIGTGEGGQAFGFGLYFAESQGVARSYRDALGSQRMKDGTPFDERNPAHWAAEAINRAGDDRAKASQLLAAEMTPDMKIYEGARYQRLLRAKGMIERGEQVPEIGAGRMYEVRINADPEHFLDWDKPLSQQSETVREAIEKVISVLPADRTYDLNKMTAGQLLNMSSRGHVEEALREYGVPGIRYKDGMSRGTDGGTTNFVIFDDKLIEITHKDGVPVKGQEGEQLYALRSDLDMSPEARKQRAEQMGFDTSRVWYHVTDADFDQFSNDVLGANTARTADSEAALESARLGTWFTSEPMRVGEMTVSDGDGGRTIPVYTRGNFYDKDGTIDLNYVIYVLQRRLDQRGEGAAERWRNDLIKKGYDGISVIDTEFGGESLIVFDPKNIRSGNAEFDPAKADSPNLMYSLRDEAPLKADLAAVDRMNQIGDLIAACRG